MNSLISTVNDKNIDPYYQMLCNFKHDPTIKDIDDRYSKNKRFLDNDFHKKIRLSGETISRLWELRIVDFLSKVDDIKLIHFFKNDKVAQPDFLFQYKGQNFFVECVCPKRGSQGNYPILCSMSKRKCTALDENTFQWIKNYFATQEIHRTIDISVLHGWFMCVWFENNKPRVYGLDLNAYGNEVRSRITNVFTEKAKKQYTANGMKQNECGLIIAISLANLHIGSQVPSFASSVPMLIESCFFPLNYIQCYEINRKTLKWENGPVYNQEECFTFKKTTHKQNGCDIESNFFSNKGFSHVSAVLFSEVEEMILSIPNPNEGVYNSRFNKRKNDFLLIHNPHAAIPLPKNILPVYKERIVKEMTEEKITFENACEQA